MSPCTPFTLGDGTYGFICSRGSRRPSTRCAYCHEPGTQLCDAETAPGKTCDRAMCPAHAHHVEPGHDYCRSHVPRGSPMPTLFDDDDAPGVSSQEPNSPRRPQTVRVWASTRGLGKCKACGAPMTWFKVVNTGKAMPFDADPTPVTTTTVDSGRVMLELRAEDTHFRTCPAAMSFRRPQ